MKRLLIVVTGLFLMYSVQAQTPVQAPNNVPEAPYLKNPAIPPFKILRVDSLRYYTRDDIKKNRRVLFIFFSPECEHCKHQTEDILADFARFKDIEIVMATFQPFDEMKFFYNKYHIVDHANIFMGRDEKYVLPPFFRMQSLPFLALYDKKGQLITHFEGNQKVDTILNAFEGKN